MIAHASNVRPARKFGTLLDCVECHQVGLGYGVEERCYRPGATLYLKLATDTDGGSAFRQAL
jgi:hypothetical protein